MKNLPKYPSTPHIPFNLNPNSSLTATEEECQSIFENDLTFVEEKVDGANCAMMLCGGEAIIRNRDHVLKKGYIKKNTPAKIQFRSAWNWFYENKKRFEELNRLFGCSVGVYGEWLLALHGIEYDALPSYFVTYDVYMPKRGFVRTDESRSLLLDAGFTVVPLLHRGRIDSFEQLATMCEEKSGYGDDLREGIYIKQCDNNNVIKRFKMVRFGYEQGSKWDNEKITKQKLKK